MLAHGGTSNSQILDYLLLTLLFAIQCLFFILYSTDLEVYYFPNFKVFLFVFYKLLTLLLSQAFGSPFDWLVQPVA